jgi:hypothetical protein
VILITTDTLSEGMSVRQQRRAIAEARERRKQAGGAAVAASAAADAIGAPAATALRTPAAQIGLQVMFRNRICRI